MAERIPARLTAKEGRKFALTVGTAFLVLAGISWWRGHLIVPRVLGGVGGLLWLAGLVIPGHLSGVYRGWMGFAHALSKVTTPIVMALIYFLTIMPIGLLMRALGRNPVRHRPVDGSLWMPRAGRPHGQLTNQF